MFLRIDVGTQRVEVLQHGESAHSSRKQEWYENVINRYF